MKESLEDKDEELLVKQLEEHKIEGEEEKDSVDEEKEGLVRIVGRIKADLESEKFKTLNQLYENYIDEEELSNKKIKPNTKRCALIFMFYIISPIFAIITLVGIFEGIEMMKIIFEIFTNAFMTYFRSLRKEPSEIIKFSLNDFNNNYNFFYKFFESAKNETYDFNLMMFFSFLGNALLNATDFRLTIALFGLLITGIGIFAILNFSFLEYNINDNTYTFLNVLYLLIIWLLFSIGVGASALLSQQIIIESNIQYNIYLIELNKEAKKRRKEKKMQFLRQKTMRVKKIENEEELKIKEEIKKKEKEEKEEEEEEEKEEEEEEEKEEKVENEGNKQKNKNNNTRNTFDFFFMICLTTIIGYLLKYFFNIIIIELNEERNKDKYLNMTNCEEIVCYENITSYKNLTTINNDLFIKLRREIYEDSYNSFFIVTIIYASCIVLSIILYSIFNCIFSSQNDIKGTDEKNTELKQINKEDINEEKEKVKKEKNTNEEIKDKKEKNDGEIKGENDEIKKENENIEIEIKHKVCEIFGCTLYCENITLNVAPMKFCKRCGLFLLITLINFLKLIYHSLCNYLYQMYCCAFMEEDEKKEIKNKLNFSKTRKSFKKNKECFCYCYKTKRLRYWLHEYITSDVQKEIFPFMIEYFILNLMTIAFEKKYFSFDKSSKSYSYSNSTNYTNFTSDINLFDENFFQNEINNHTIDFDKKNYQILKNDELYTFLTFIGTFILFFYFTLSFGPAFKCTESNKKDKKKLARTMKLSKEILDGTHGILIFNGYFSLLFSSLYFANEKNSIFDSIYLYFIPVLMNKFYYFTLIYYCISYSEQKKKFDLISGSTLISVHLYILESIIRVIRDYSPLKNLYITQLVIACILPGLLSFFIFCTASLTLCIRHNLSLCLIISMCFISHIFCFGGFYWWDIQSKIEKACLDEDNDCALKCNKFEYTCCECEDNDCGICCFDCLDECNCCDCIGFLCQCECIDCCQCYDCFRCCSCFYCCGDSCECYGCC